MKKLQEKPMFILGIFIIGDNGIELSLTKHIVQGHGGHISFFEEEGWTCFLMQF